MSKKILFLSMALIIGVSFFVGAKFAVADVTSSITVLSPNGGESWQKLTTQTIKWQDSYTGCVTNSTGATACIDTAARPYDLKLAPYYPPCTGTICPAYAIHQPYTIAKNVSGVSYQWGVGKIMDLYDGLAPDGAYTVQVCQTGTGICDSSDSYFKIYSVTTQPSITVLSPNGGETYKNDGSSITVNWQTNNVPSSHVINIIRLRAYPNGQEYNLAMNVLNDGQEVIPIPSSVPVGAYTLEIKTYVGETLVMDSSDSYFKIIDVSRPSVTILSPNGGETYKNDGSPITVKWQTNNVPSSHAIDVIRLRAYPNGQEYNLATNVLNDGQEVIPIPSSVPVGAYTLEIKTYVGETLVMDSSDSYFKIISGSSNNGLPKIVGFPAIPTKIQPGQTVNISLSATDPDNDDLSWSVDWGENIGAGGACSITRRQTGTGWNFRADHAWTQAGTYQVKISVNDCVGGSDSYSFSLTVGNSIQPSITVLSPNGGESWQKGTTQTIKWQDSYTGCVTNSTGATACIDIVARLYDIKLVPYYPPCTGTICPAYAIHQPYTIAKNVSGGSYSWPVAKTLDWEGSAGDGSYTIQICQSGSGTPCDSSDSYFTVTTSSTTIEEQVKCVFKGSASEQKCYTATDNSSPYSGYGCSGTESCVVDMKGINGDKITWKSSCGGYAYSVMDGSSEYAIFYCAGSDTTTTPTVSRSSNEQILDMNEKSKLLSNNNFDFILAELNQLRSIIKEQQTQIKYLSSLLKDIKGISVESQDAINNFITYGVDANTQKLGAGERAAVINSYKVAFDKLPETEAELADAIKIANGRWPSITNDAAEKKAKEQFQKIYKRIADMNNANDNAAVTVMAYGLRQKAANRNLNSEKQGIQIFKGIYGHVPSSTQDWNTMQAITYSGASRGTDSDGDLLTDDREKELGTDPKNKDTDGDGYLDGAEVANGFDPLKK